MRWLQKSSSKSEIFSVLPTSCCRLTTDSVRTTSHMYPLLSRLLFGQGICTVWYGLRKHWMSVTKQTHQVILNNNKRKELKSLQLSPWSHSKLINLLIQSQTESYINISDFHSWLREDRSTRIPHHKIFWTFHFGKLEINQELFNLKVTKKKKKKKRTWLEWIFDESHGDGFLKHIFVHS